MSIITTGINIVATGVSTAMNQIKRFGQSLSQTERNVNNFANRYNTSQRQMIRSSMGLGEALSTNWRTGFDRAMRSANPAKSLKALEQQYDRTFRNIGNKYQSMVMGSVALSMSGIGIKNVGLGILGMAKSSLDAAKDFELAMKQIQFYGHRTDSEMTVIQKKVIQMGIDLPVTTSEVANSVLEAQKLGYDSVKDAMKMAKEASKIQFMGLGKINGEESLKYISQFRQLTGTSIKDVDTLTDKLSKTADVSAASIDSLWKTIQSSRTAYDSLGADVDTFLTLTGTLADRLTPRNAGMALNSFAGGVQMAEKARREYRATGNKKMTRGKNYDDLIGAMGGKNMDAYKGDILQYIQDIAVKSKEIWGNGSERKGNLQSIFGKSAVDLFYAIDSAMKKTGKSMHGIRDEIEQSSGHAKKYMDVIMNSSYGTEEILKGLKEQFQILFGIAIRPLFNSLLKGISAILKGINKFAAAHPKLVKILGYGFGIAGLLLTATGATMIFVGGILAIYASLMNLFVQLARNTRVLNLLSSGFSTAGAMIRAQMLSPIALLGKALLRMSAITFFMYVAWKNDFFRMRTKFLEWKDAISKGLKDSQGMWSLYAQGSAKSLNQAFSNNSWGQAGFRGFIANTWTKARMLWDGIKDIWKDGTISTQKYQMLKDAGLLPYIEEVYKWKTRLSDFWKGFQDGLKDGVQLLKTLFAPLKPIWEWMSKKLLQLFQHFGLFKNVGKGIGSQWQQWGEYAGYLVGSAIAIRVALWGWMKAIKLALTPFRIMLSISTKIINTLNKLKGIGKLIGKMGKLMAKVLVPKPLRNLAGYANERRRQRAMGQGASSPLPQSRTVIDPTTRRPRQAVNPTTGTPLVDPRTGAPINETTHQRPRTWRERWRLRREQRRTQGSTREGVVLPNGRQTSNTRRSRNPFRRIKDWWLGETYIPEERVDSRGRTYNQVRTRTGTSRTDAQGRVRGQYLRSGGMRERLASNRLINNRLTNNRVTRATGRVIAKPFKLAGSGFTKLANLINKGASKIGSALKTAGKTLAKPFTSLAGKIKTGARRARANASLMNSINFADAGMDYGSSKSGNKFMHKVRSVKASVKGAINRGRLLPLQAGGTSLAGQMQNRQNEIPEIMARQEEERKQRKQERQERRNPTRPTRTSVNETTQTRPSIPTQNTRTRTVNGRNVRLNRTNTFTGQTPRVSQRPRRSFLPLDLQMFGGTVPEAPQRETRTRRLRRPTQVTSNEPTSTTRTNRTRTQSSGGQRGLLSLSDFQPNIDLPERDREERQQTRRTGQRNVPEVHGQSSAEPRTRRVRQSGGSRRIIRPTSSQQSSGGSSLVEGLLDLLPDRDNNDNEERRPKRRGTNHEEAPRTRGRLNRQRSTGGVHVRSHSNGRSGGRSRGANLVNTVSDLSTTVSDLMDLLPDRDNSERPQQTRRATNTNRQARGRINRNQHSGGVQVRRHNNQQRQSSGSLTDLLDLIPDGNNNNNEREHTQRRGRTRGRINRSQGARRITAPRENVLREETRMSRGGRAGGGRFSRIINGAKNLFSRGRGVENVARQGARGGGSVIGKMFKGGGKLLGGLFKGGGNLLGKSAGLLGKGLLKGLGVVLKKGLPLIFKIGLRAIPFLGEALMIWDAISMIWSNWDSIAKGAKWLWDKVKQFGKIAWDGIKALSGVVWDWVKAKAKGIWDGIKTWALGIWNAIKGFANTVWNAIKGFASSVWNGIKSVATNVWNTIKSWASNVWNAIKGFATTVWNGIKTFATSVWNAISTTASTVWNAIKTFATNVWNGIKSVATTVWNAISSTASTIWNAIKGFASTVWNAIKGFGQAIWSGIQSTASGMWNAVKGFASGVWNAIKGFGVAIWNGIKSTATTMWNGIKSFGQGIWSGIKDTAVSIWDGIKSTVNGIFSGLLGAFTTAWNSVVSFAKNNPITSTVKKVVESVKEKALSWLPGHRTGLWNVPKDNYAANLHQGEMVLTRKEAQIMRQMVGSDNNSISQFLLGKKGNGGDAEVTTAKPTKQTPKLSKQTVNIKTQPAKSNQGSGDTSIVFEQGAVQIQIANASKAEIQKGAKQLFEEFKRMVELQNVKNYKQARPRTT